MSQLFLKKLQIGVALGDGAMGTQLYERGIYVNRKGWDRMKNLRDRCLAAGIPVIVGCPPGAGKG